MIVTVYEIETGRIHRIVDAPNGLAQLQAGDGESWVVGKSDDRTQYVSGGLIADRPAMSGALDKASITAAETATLTGPPAATVEIVGPVNGSGTLDADGIEIGSDVPGIYTVRVQLWPYLDAEYQLEITEA
jgi:hypothetical protein